MAADSLARLKAFDAANPFGRPQRVKLKKSNATKRRSPEYDLHVSVVNRLKRCLLDGAFVFHVPNARQGNDQAAAKDRLHRSIMGVMPGAPDLLVIHRGRVLAIELKASTGSVSDSQKWAHTRFQDAGSPVSVCRSVDDVGAFLTRHGVPLDQKFFAPSAADRNAKEPVGKEAQS